MLLNTIFAKFGIFDRAYFLICFAVFRSFRTISIETETELGLYKPVSVSYKPVSVSVSIEMVQ